MSIRRTVVYMFYKRRANKLEVLINMLGFDFAVRYGERRGWVEKHDGTRIWLRRGRV